MWPSRTRDQRAAGTSFPWMSGGMSVTKRAAKCAKAAQAYSVQLVFSDPQGSLSRRHSVHGHQTEWPRAVFRRQCRVLCSTLKLPPGTYQIAVQNSTAFGTRQAHHVPALPTISRQGDSFVGNGK
jgi:hypothetical protein